MPELQSVDFSPRRQAFDSAMTRFLDRSSSWLTRHWLLAINTIAALLAGGAFLAPALLALGYNLPPRIIFFFYSFMCHQLPQRAYFVFGYQVAQCQRNTAIYGSLFLGGVIFGLARGRLKPIDWRTYGLLILPMAVDGFTQLFGWRESNWELRTLTGSLFGLACVWFVYPHVEKQLRAARQSGPIVHRVVIYTKEDCSLCEKAKTIVQRLEADYRLAIEEVDITTDQDLYLRYRYLIPVIHVNGRVAAVTKVSEVWLRRAIQEYNGVH